MSEPMYKEWVIDATLHDDAMGLTCFCPVVDGDSVITGMSFLSDMPPEGGKVVGVFHRDGNEAAQQWLDDHPEWREHFRGETP